MNRREYFIYDGQHCIGHFVVDDKTGAAKAFNAAGRLLGTFPGYDAARKAVSQAYCDAVERKAATEETLDRLNGPVEFKSGLPTW